MTRAPVEPVVLHGRIVRLEPLSLDHLEPLWAASSDAELFRFYPYRLASPDDLRRFILEMQRKQAAGEGLGFATRVRASGTVVGSSGFHEADPHHRRVEIGATWATPAAQRTAVNTEAKYLMLRHAFEVLGMLRVEFKTDARNSRSRAALLRIGATEEGIHRHHMVMPDGANRDSVYFSIIAPEWPSVKRRLEQRLQQA